MHIRPYRITDEEAVINLWEICGLTRPWNNPKRDIERKLRVDPDLFLVGEVEGRLVAAAMAGYEGHRGWVNYLAVHPDYQGRGLGRRMMEEIEAKLIARGCPKINVQIRSDNEGVIAFYRRLGFRVDATVSMGKRLIED